MARRLGFHLSIAGSLSNAPIEAHRHNYGAFQIFTTSSRSWANSKIDDEESDSFIRHTKGNNLEAFAHIPYLCNPASANRTVYGKSGQMLINNMGNCEKLKINCLVIHLGSHLGKGSETGIDNVCDMIETALDSTKEVSILLENGSGYRNSVGSKFSEIGKIIDTIGSKRIGVCFDTCHAFAAGYDLRDPESVDRTMEEFSDNVKLSLLGLVHLNDAKYPLGSGLDRHYHIGKGKIGKEGFASLFCNKSFRDGSFIMELPEDNEGTHADDMKAVKAAIEASRS